MTKDNNEQGGEIRGNVAKTMLYKVAKTMLYRKPAKNQDLPQQPEAPQALPSETPKTKVAKTKLDHKLIMNVQSQFGERKNERLQQEIATRQAEPVKQIDPIEAQKKVSSCPFSWTEESLKVRVKHCANCQKALYQFDGLEIAEAQALILKREGLEKFVLYERPDGKYMTSDCPVAHKKRMQIVGVVAAVCICIIASIAAFILTGPASTPTSDPTAQTAPDPSTQTAPDSTAPSAVTSPEEHSAAVDSSKSGTQHYHIGDPMPVVPSSQPAKPKTPEKTFSQQEQSGEFWQYPNGQPADDFSRGQSAPAP